MRYERAPVFDERLDYHHVVYPFNARDEFRRRAAMPLSIGRADRGAAQRDAIRVTVLSVELFVSIRAALVRVQKMCNAQHAQCASNAVNH